jgi:hypothetical protein
MEDRILKTSATVLANLGDLLAGLEPVYKDIHAHPELSMQRNTDGWRRGGPSSCCRL